MKTGNIQLVKKINKSIVLESVRKNAPISRADIAQSTGLNKGTVSSLVSELIIESFVYESGPGTSSGGRRPVLLHFNHQAGYAIGIDIGVTEILSIITDLEGTIIHEQTLHLANTQFPSVMESIFQLIDQCIDHMPNSPYGIIGIGIGIPGMINNKDQILLAPNLKWKNVNIKQQLEDRYDFPIIIENEANAGAYGEKLYGAGKDTQDLVYMSVGTGIGTGIIIDNHLFKGANGLSGEMGHISIDLNGKTCQCGNIGCWELYASEQALINEANQKKDLLTCKQNQRVPIDLDELMILAETNCSPAIELFHQAGQYLGMGMINIINTFNPSKIIIGNRLAKASHWLETSLLKVVNERAIAYHQNHVDICFSKLSSYSTALGVSAFVVDHFISHLYHH